MLGSKPPPPPQKKKHEPGSGPLIKSDPTRNRAPELFQYPDLDPDALACLYLATTSRPPWPSDLHHADSITNVSSDITKDTIAGLLNVECSCNCVFREWEWLSARAICMYACNNPRERGRQKGHCPFRNCRANNPQNLKKKK